MKPFPQQLFAKWPELEEEEKWGGTWSLITADEAREDRNRVHRLTVWLKDSPQISHKDTILSPAHVYAFLIEIRSVGMTYQKSSVRLFYIFYMLCWFLYFYISFNIMYLFKYLNLYFYLTKYLTFYLFTFLTLICDLSFIYLFIWLYMYDF